MAPFCAVVRGRMVEPAIVSRRTITGVKSKSCTFDPCSNGERFHLGGEILCAVVDRRVGAEPQAGGAFLVRSGGGENAGAELAGELDGGDADAAGAAVDQGRLSFG